VDISHLEKDMKIHFRFKIDNGTFIITDITSDIHKQEAK